MSTSSISAVQPMALPEAPAKTNPKPTDKVAREFEEVFIRQILQSAHALGGKSDGAGSGYAGMALDALASGLSDAGGIGLARTIQGVIDRAQAHEIKKETPVAISPKDP